MSVPTEHSELDPVQVTLTYPGNNKDYTTPFEVNVYAHSEPYVEGELGAFIGKGLVQGCEADNPVEGEDPEEGALVLEIENGKGGKVLCPAFFFELVPVDADTQLSDDTPRISYDEYMNQVPA